jgi:hypothetical protein
VSREARPKPPLQPPSGGKFVVFIQQQEHTWQSTCDNANGAALFGAAPLRVKLWFSKLSLTDVRRLQALRAADNVELQPLAFG